ncbi:MAG: TolC family protein [Terriglobia bacterium]|jgi:outer membrane protein TolC|nr:TolC family protein [Terriglobia bacterium]
MRVSRFVSLGVFALASLAAVPLVAQQSQQGQAQLPEGPKPQAQSEAAKEIDQLPTKTLDLHTSGTDYSKGASILSVIGPYKPRLVPPPVLKNSPRIDQLMQDGKLMLSLSDAIALALENNLDLAISRYNNDIADTDLLRVKSGAAPRGVNTGLVANTPGGTGATNVGGGAGGTSTGAGGAGAGAGGIVSSTLGAGPAIDSFDPIVTSNFQMERANTPNAFTLLTGQPVSNQNTTTANFAYSQGFETGTLMNFTFDNSRTTSNSRVNDFNPQLNSNFRLQLRQHLLSGCCLFVNRRNIMAAGNNKQIADLAFENQVMYTVTQIEDIYWDMVNAYQNLLVNQRSLALAEKTLSDNQKQVQIGTLAPIEVVRAQSAVASAQQNLIVAQTNLQLEQLLMKNAITRNLSDPTLATAPVIPTDTMVVTEETLLPVDELVNEALRLRPDINSQRINLKNRDISRKATKNALLPTLDLYGFYGGSAISGVPNPLKPTACVLPDGSPCPITGIGSALSDTFSGSYPDKGVALQLLIPIRNRTAQADQVRSQLEYRQAELLQHQLESQINIQVRNAAYAVQQNKAAVDAAKANRELAIQSLDAEQKKYALGASTNTLVLQAQTTLTQAEVNYVTALTNYEKARVTLDQVTGTTLQKLGIVLSDAAIGKISSVPMIPGVVNVNSPEGQQQRMPEQEQQQMQQQTPPQQTVPPTTEQPQATPPQNPPNPQ